MSKLSCEIIRDILPLYYDNVCSDDSKSLVEEHLDHCQSCKLELDRLKVDFEIPKEEIETIRNDSNVIKNISSLWKRSKIKSFATGVIISLVLVLLISFGYNRLFHLNTVNVPTNVMEISQVSQLSDGKIVFHFEVTDGYALNETIHDMDKNGNFYITPVRPVIKKKAQPPYGMANDYYFIDIEQEELHRDSAEIKAIYIGTPKENILVWKDGMDLPKASKEIENMFHFE
ncbi:zf-HC2 domain-containing protein [Lysinibacillus sp. NPDC056185]|uniref:zf-HC2 domain-containing protein n=1 Tax=Lysinibacillus sp. NPDC056185 TaxID=3345739 RepID=UPI0039F0D3A8